ncbi:MAG: HAD family hydrolase, partial [Nitrososphaerales archaeon]
IQRVQKDTSYPNPVGKSLLSTLFDEMVYGRVVFREMYGFECVTEQLSNPGLIANEKKLVSDKALETFSLLSGGNLGVITGRPRIPTIFTLGDTFARWFTKPELCLFTGDYILDMEEAKPSPKPMINVAKKLCASKEPILYVGDSGEDLLMVKNANGRGLDCKVYFAGIASSKEKARYFESEGERVDCVVSGVNELASVAGSNAEILRN